MRLWPNPTAGYAGDMKRILTLGSLWLLASCQTTFYGSPMFPGGATACRAHCQRDGLEMRAFVYSGEFSTSCVCGVPGGPVADVADAAAVAGVAVMKARQEEQRRQQNRIF